MIKHTQTHMIYYYIGRDRETAINTQYDDETTTKRRIERNRSVKEPSKPYENLGMGKIAMHAYRTLTLTHSHTHAHTQEFGHGFSYRSISF